MHCPHCQADNREGRRFCAKCGRPLAAACSSCGFANEPDEEFCGGCGASLRPPTPAVSPASYTPRHLAEKILTSRSALQGERKQVTVMFCDVADSSRLAERLGPEGMHEVMDRALRLMADAVHRYEGTVNQFLGDGLMALFGAPIALEDHALRAIQAALVIQETIAGYSATLRAERGVEIRLRIGLHTGLVVVGRIGDDLRMDYTAVGGTTHLAARMQAAADPGTILTTDTTHRLIGPHVRSEALGAIRVKGWEEPVAAYRVTGRRRSRGRLEVMAERNLTPLVGRQRELGILLDCVARVRSGRGHIVGIVGEPGVGKSRLLHEFRKSLDGEEITWLEGHGVAYGQSTPYLPILEILRANFRIEEGDNPLQIGEKVRRGLASLDPALAGTAPFLLDLVGLPPDDEAPGRLDPKERRQKTFDAIRTLTVAGSQRRPLVIVVEDLHWVDRTSEDYLAFLSESLPAMRVLLVTTHRPGYAVRWTDKTYYTQIALDLLSEAEAERMIAALLSARVVPPDMFRAVWSKAEGNPLFLEEVTAALVERGIVVRQDDTLRVSGTLDLELPATIQDIIRARIDRLDEPVKRTVQTAAVIGREFGVRLLAKIGEIADDVHGYLGTLKRLELIHEKRFFPELEYIFKHAVTQDVAYQSLLVQRRRELHETIGRAIEELYADHLEEQAAILAYHYGRSTRQDRAVTYALLAGDVAARLCANVEARTFYQQALATARELPPADGGPLSIDATVKLAGVASTREHFQEDLANLEAARALAATVDDRARLSRVLYWLGRTHYSVGRLDASVDYATEALQIAEALQDLALEAPPVNLLARAYNMRGEFRQSTTLAERNVQQMRAIGNPIEEAGALGVVAITRGQLGEFRRALEAADASVRLAESLGHLPTLAASLFYRACMRSWLGDPEAFADFRRVLALAERTGDIFRTYLGHGWRGWGRHLIGDYSGALEDLQRATALAQRLGTRFALAQFTSFVASARAHLGSPVEALPLAREALASAQASGVPWEIAVTSRSLAEVLLAQTPPSVQEAAQAIRAAIDIQERVGMTWELTLSRLVYSRVLDAAGESDERARILSEALRAFEQMGVGWGIERARRALGEA